ncbi:MAG: glycosyltransferase [Bacteroidales bacterium]|nr:glycosyltransferase [Bacteroidales bacterium]
MLVSIIVITYNSSRFVEETLESVWHQTYQNLELIVSDDCSIDDTFRKCQLWAKNHMKRFNRIICTQTSHNGGICWNYNHALKHACGKWIKFIAGDDILDCNCIENFINQIEPRCYLYSCDIICFNNATKEKHIVDRTGFVLPYCSARRQLYLMLRFRYDFGGQGLFVEREHLLDVGGFDEQFPMLEDYPLLMRFLTHGLCAKYIPEHWVTWRMHDDNVSGDGRCSQSLSDAIWHYSRHYCLRYGLALHLYHYWVDHWVLQHSHKSNARLLWGYFFRVFDIVRWKRKFIHTPRSRRG